MELIFAFLKLVQQSLISVLIPAIITLQLVKKIFKNEQTVKACLNYIRWIIIAYSFYLLIANMYYWDFTFRYLNKSSPHSWIMPVCILLPISLLNKRVSKNIWYLTLMALTVNLPQFLEEFVIIVTSYHRDYVCNNELTDLLLVTKLVAIRCTGGAILTSLLLLFHTLRLKYINPKTLS